MNLVLALMTRRSPLDPTAPCYARDTLCFPRPSAALSTLS